VEVVRKSESTFKTLLLPPRSTPQSTSTSARRGGRLVSVVADDNAGKDADLGDGDGDNDSVASTSDDEDKGAETIPQGQLDLVLDEDEE
jgi:hypothetical protein